MVSVRQKYRGGETGRGEGDEAGESNQNGKRMIGAGWRRRGRHNAVRDVGRRWVEWWWWWWFKKTKRDDSGEEE